MGARKWVRFYPNDWRKAADQMSRLEQSVYFDICFFNWRKRRACSLQEIHGMSLDLANWKEIVDGLERGGFLILRAAGYVAVSVKRMANRTGNHVRMPSNRWAETRLRIFERDGHTCRYCGDRDCPLECDHVVPLSRGGSDDDDNLATACRPCNRRKHAKLLVEWGGEI